MTGFTKSRSASVYHGGFLLFISKSERGVKMGEYKEFITKINKRFGIDLALYKEAQMKRRLTSLRNKRGFKNFTTYFDALMKDEDLLEEFFDRITINVSEFYRNPKRWDVLREKVFPELIKNKQRLKIWSAACSSGEEPYSLAIMLKEHFSHVNFSILATDIDERSLRKAQRGIYNESALKSLPKHKKSKYFIIKDNKYVIRNELKQYITFQKHDLLKDTYPQEIDLIVCRNVLIYFTDEAKDNIYRRFSESLTKNGILFVGSTEQIFHPYEYGLQLYDTFFYQKI